MQNDKAMLLEGKGKRLRAGTTPNTVVIETKEELTAGDGLRRVRLAGIAEHKTQQAVNIFRFLERRGIPTAFVEYGEQGFVCSDCEMVPLELVSRRYPYGSLLKREPAYASGEAALRPFDTVRTEVFHKWTLVTAPASAEPALIPEAAARERYLSSEGWAAGVYTDPYVQLGAERWWLHPAKQLFDARGALFAIDPLLTEAEMSYVASALMRPCFEALEQALACSQSEVGPTVLVDMKIEVGKRKSDGALVIADVIDNDNWRIWPAGDRSRQLDKQAFRDGMELDQVARNYAAATRLTALLV